MTLPTGGTGGRWTRREPLAGDASTRRYTRLRDRAGGSAILVEYPPDPPGTLARDLEVAGWLTSVGLRLPAVIDADPAAGWTLLEDLGADDAEASLRSAAGPQRAAMIAALMEPLVQLSAQAPELLPSWNRPLDRDRLRWELTGFELWFVRHRRGRVPDPKLGRWLDGLASEVAAHPRRICHRDYHLNNLFLLDEGGVAVIDAQDALVGPDTYDAVSLLEERAMPELVSDAERARWRQFWAERTAAAAGWQQRWALVRTQRALKVLGTFARLEEGGRGGYGGWLRAVATRLAADADGLALPAALVDLLLD
ncbi:MAG: phosphotransferase [Deltaproteobacteria bacterium]|nr:phosphotransferase [Deltaproteobacteria bacterium]MBW2535804.1 phosphotransferase [Deltaproteobacteria bacterium]